jgi:hypothetical protein
VARFYKSGRSQRLRKLQLTQPLCKFCLERGVVTAAKVADQCRAAHGRLGQLGTGKLVLLGRHREPRARK